MRKRERASERREEILAATVDLVSEFGHQAVRISDVAGRLSVSPGLVIYHFSTKEELLARAFAFAAENDLIAARRIERAEKDPLRRLVAIVRWYAPTQAGSRSWRLWIDGWAASLFNPQLAGVIGSLDATWRDMLESAIAECAAAEVVEVGDARTAALQLAAYIDGIAVTSVTGSAELTPADLFAWLKGYLVHQLGIAPAALPA